VASGGETEVQSLIPFLEKNFNCKFQRKTPARRKPGPKPGVKTTAYGRTGQGLINQISQELPIALKNEPKVCSLILVFDDLDCRDPTEEKEKFLDAISKFPECADIPRIVGFAAPEIESWIIGDWHSTMAKHKDFRAKSDAILWRLSHKMKEMGFSFDAPESFSKYDSQRNCCEDKLSELLMECSQESSVLFRKGYHTPSLLLEIQPSQLMGKCPLFRRFYTDLQSFCK